MSRSRRSQADTVAAFVPLPAQLPLFAGDDVEIRFHHADNLKRPDLLKIAAVDAVCHEGTGEDTWSAEEYEHKLCGTMFAFAGVARLKTGRIVGCVLWKEQLHTVQIERLFVAVPLRRQGIGRKLLDFAIAKSNQAKEYVRAFANVNNFAAAHFFSNTGMPVCEEMPGWYGDDAGYFFLRSFRTLP